MQNGQHFDKSSLWILKCFSGRFLKLIFALSFYFIIEEGNGHYDGLIS